MSRERFGAWIIIFIAIISLPGIFAEHCPHQCKCNDQGNYTCNLSEHGVNLELDVSKGSFTAILVLKCQNKEVVNCNAFPYLGVAARMVQTYSCSPSILRCVHVLLDEPIIDLVELHDVSGQLTSEDVADFEYVDHLTLLLTGDTLVPITAINSWSSLTAIHLTGGILDVFTNSFNHSTLNSFYLNSTDISTAPVGYFDGLPNLESLTLDHSTIEEIRVGAFKGLTNLNQLRIEQCPLRSVDPEAFADVPKMDQFVLYNHLLDSFPNELLKRMELLTFVSFICDPSMYLTELNLDPHAYSEHPGFINLQLVSCKVNHLPGDLFSNSTNILMISIIDNNINSISEKIFSNIPKIETLYLYNNSLPELPRGIFDNITLLKTLELDNNALRELPEGIFDKLTALQSLDLTGNGLRKLRETVFKNLGDLETLKLEKNNIHELPEGIFKHQAKLETLNLANNGLLKLHKNAFLNVTSLKYLNLANNKLLELPAIYYLKDLKTIDLSDNRLERLSSYMFYGPHLTELSLRNNKINVIESATYDDGYSSPFVEQPVLDTLDLSGNKIRELFDGWDSHLENVQVLNLSSNRFTDIKIFQVNYTRLNITIDLQYNNIFKTVLDPRTSDINDMSKATSQLLLDHNPIKCDCNAFGLFQRLKGARLRHEPKYILNNSICMSPPNLKGDLLEKLSPIDLICDLSKHRPENCSNFIARADINEVDLTCSQIPLPLPDLNADQFIYSFFEKPSIALNLDEQPLTIEGLNIHKLNISNANINTINFKPTDSLKVLDVSFNNLVNIPDAFFNANVTLYLANNPLNCDCSLVRKLKQYSFLDDTSSVFCANEGKNLTEIDEHELCNRTNAMTAFVGTTAVIGLFLTMIAVAMCKYIRRNWQSIVSSLRGRQSENTVLLKEVGTAKRFDVFIYFEYQDEEFVRESLLPKLEYQYKQKVCVNYRDWPPGSSIADQIIQSVNNAKRSIIVLSEDFLLSEWSTMIVRKAQDLDQDGRPKLTLVLFNEDITKDDRLSDDLKSYIKAHSYLLWEDPNFWQNIKDILRIKD